MSRFIQLFQFALITFVAAPAFAEGGVSSGAAAAAFAIAVAAFGGAIGQGRAAAAALEGIARNPGAKGDIFTPMILALALIESLVIYALLVAFKILG
ncbi:MAG: ATP synthase F0 subunit C [Deltaproteobacteria bacterium]|nr:ATP synthase F0 subunit C [Deltaproteobacteria bacterium]